MKKTIKILSVFLATIMFFSVFSAANPVFAAELQMAELTEESQSQTAEADSNITDEGASSEVEVLGEIIELRDEYTKYFRQSDGSYIAAQYSMPVHYREGSDWVEYNFELEEKQSEKRLFTSSSVYEPVSSDIPVKFPTAFSKYGNNEISINVADTIISFAPKAEKSEIKSAEGKLADETELVSASVTSSAEISTFSQAEELKNEEEKKNDALKVSGQKSAVKYEDVFDSISLEYELSSNVLKESIVLSEVQEKNTFEFTMNLGGLYPRKEADGSIVLYKDSAYTQAQSVIAAPYMLDSAGTYSDAVSMELTPDGEEYILTITADENWLKSSERVYPIIIDPTIVLDISRANTLDCYVDASQPNSKFPLDYYLYAGHSTLGRTRAFIKFNLPALPDKCCVVQSATLNIYQMSVDAGSEKRYISVHRVTEQWSNTTTDAPTWNNQPAFESGALDYAELTHDIGDLYSFDITKAVKSWFESGNNYGIVLKGLDETKVGRAQIISAEFNISQVIYPTVSVTYRNNKGLEGYWSYSSFSEASCGSASINDYSGNLVYQIPIASTVSEIMPVSLSLVYNTYSSDEIYVSGKNNSNLTTAGRGWKFNIQETVLPSTQYGLTGDSAEKYPYVYTDGDGTEHYIQKVSKEDKNEEKVVTYEDEDGLGLKVEKTDSEYKITDKMDNIRLFNAQGNLKEIKDANGNSIEITYDNATGKKLQRITDGTGHTLTFDYYPNSNYVKTIADNAGRVVELNITDSKLNYVQYYDGTKTCVVYEDLGTNQNTALINYVWSSDRVGLNFDYTASGKGYRVRKVTEFAAQVILPSVEGYARGQVVTFDRTSYNTTVIRSGGIDGITYDTSTDTTTTQTEAKRYDDIVTTLQFDNFGRVVSQQVSYGNGGEVGAGAYNYTATGNTSDSKNKIADAASLGKNTVNMLTNGTCESLTGWTQNTSVAATNVEFYTVTGIQHSGKNALALRNASTISTAVNTNYSQKVNGWKSGSPYTLSAFVRTLNLTKLNKGGLEGAYLQITETRSNGTKTYYSQVLTEDTEDSINNGWRRLSVSVTPDANTTQIYVYLCLRNAIGKAYFDDVQFEDGSTPNSVNLLENSSFEAVKTTNAPAYWATQNITDTTKDGSTTTHKDGTYGLKLNGEPDKEKAYFQTIDVQGNPNDTYIVSGWAAAYAVNSTYHSHFEKEGVEITDEEAGKILNGIDEEEQEKVKVVDDSRFEIAVTVFYKDENGNDRTQDKEPLKFNTNISSWQYGSKPIVLKYVDDKNTSEDDGKTYTPVKLRISLVYANQANYAYFDHIQLIKDVAQSYVYDKDGNVVSVSANAEQKNNMKYDGEDNLQEYTDAGGNTTKFEYEENTHTLTKVTSPKGVKTQYCYNSKGQNTVTETVNTGGAVKIKTETEYVQYGEGSAIKDGAYISSVKDQFGNATTYTNDKQTGAVTNITSPNGLITVNGYDDYKSKLTSVTAGNTKVSYNYGNDNRLDDIIFADKNNSNKYEKFVFGYDNFGRILTTKVGNGNIALSTNEYDNGTLARSVYGNGDAVRYDYTYSGLTSAVYQDNNAESSGAAYTWQYSSNGMPRTHKDGYAKLKYNYSYDSIGRLIRTDISDSINGTAVGSTEYGYNTRGHLVSVSNEIGGRAYKQYYSYSDTGVAGSLANAQDGLPTRYTALGVNTDYSYDSLNRLYLRRVKVSDTVNLDNTYTYHTTNRYEDDKTYYTTRLATESVAGISHAYSYDKMGNITNITRGDAAYKSYTYDALGEMRSETQHTLNRKTNYVYDAFGNISSQTTVNATTNANVSKVTYNYSKDSDAGWNYLLTSLTFTDYTNSSNNRTETIDYDAIGNPLSYRGATMSWFGRQLHTYSKNGISANFMYDADGLRSSKTVNGVKTTYQYVGDQLFYEKIGENKTLYYFYDSYGNLSQIYYTFSTGENASTARYFVSTNAQGDVIGLYNYNGVKVGAYDYDAWGNTRMFVVTQDADGNNVHTQINPETQYLNHIVNVNPIRYRGYYYDSDLDLYYLQSRYYDAEIGRFINADSEISDVGGDVLGYNMFAYCTNNPVNLSDETGTWPSWSSLAKKIAIGVGAVLVGAAVVAATAATGGAAAAFVGAAVAGLKAAAISGAIGAAVGAGTSAVSHRISTGSWEGADKAAVDGAVNGFADGFMTGGITAGAGMTVGALGKTSSGVQIGKTEKPQYGKVNAGYGTPKTNGNTLISIQNNAGKRMFSLDLDSIHAVHMHLPKLLPGKHIPIGAIGSGIYAGVRQW